MLATRSADNEATLAYANMVGAQDGLVFDGGGFVFQNGRPMLEAPRFREGWTACVVDLDRTVRARREASTWRSDCEAFQRQEIAGAGAAQRASHRGRPSRCPIRRRPGRTSSCRRRGRRARTAREEVLDDMIEALALGVRDYFREVRRLPAPRRRPLRRPRLDADPADRLAGRLPPPGGRQASEAEVRKRAGAMIQAFYMPTRYSGEGTRGAAATLAEELGVSLRVVPIEEAFDREVEATREMLARRRADRDHPPERAGARCAAAAHVELGEQLGRPVPADRRHEREGGGLHHHRRRSRGGAVGDRQRAEDGGERPARALPGALRLRRHPPDAGHRARPGARRRRRRPRRS